MVQTGASHRIMDTQHQQQQRPHHPHQNINSWARFHSYNGTMHRPNAPPKLTLSSPLSDRGSQALLSSPMSSNLPRTAPLERADTQRIYPSISSSSHAPSSRTSNNGTPVWGGAQGQVWGGAATTPNYPEGSLTSKSRVSTKSSYESFNYAASNGSHRDRSGSSDTVKGMPAEQARSTNRSRADSMTDGETSTTDGYADDGYADERMPLRENFSPFTRARRTSRSYVPRRSYGSVTGRRMPSPEGMSMKEDSRRAMLSSIMAGVMLALQGTMALGVFAALVWVTIWQREITSPAFWSWLWTVGQPALAIEILLCFGALLVHELRGGLSSVALLYIQCGILLIATVTTLGLAERSFAQESLVVKGVVMGCDVALWGMAFLGFVRAAVVWRAQGMDGEEGEEDCLETRRWKK